MQDENQNNCILIEDDVNAKKLFKGVQQWESAISFKNSSLGNLINGIISASEIWV